MQTYAGLFSFFLTISLAVAVFACQTACYMLVRHVDKRHVMTCCLGSVLVLFRHPSVVALWHPDACAVNPADES